MCFFVIQVLQDHQIENLLNEMFSSEDENDEDEDEDPYSDYVPKSFNARLNDIQGISNRQLLHFLDDDARQSNEDSPNEEIPPYNPPY